MTDDELKTLFAENRRHFDAVAERMETRLEAVAESVTNVDQKLDRRVDSLEDRMQRSFADTQAMIKSSHADLDRLESTTH